MWFQAVSCLNVIRSNIFFNGPRAAINFNDGTHTRDCLAIRLAAQVLVVVAK